MFAMIPPHLMSLAALLLFILWFMLVHHFRRNSVMQTFVAETIGDNTAEKALHDFLVARSRLAAHLDNRELDIELRHKIEQALETQYVVSTPDFQGCS